MLPVEPTTTSTNLVKLVPKAKLPSAPVMQVLSAAEAKLLKRLVSEPVEYVPDPFLDQPAAAGLLHRPLYEWEDVPTHSDDSGVYGLEQPGEAVRQLERERYLFLRLNYCRRQMFNILTEFAGRRLTEEAARALLRWEQLTTGTRGEVVRENIPLVLAMAKRTRITGVGLTDLISEGNLALLRAVNKFDCARGYRFSTYACRAILKSFSRVATRMARHRGRFPTEFDPALERGNSLEQNRVRAEGECVHELKSILTDNSARLSDVEQKVILARFALDPCAGDPAEKAKTLEQVGEMIGVTKERVRQIQNKALTKLRAALEQAVLTQ
ncbi:MAG TPA: sigma-70 family RNA polymerase sigma factor [Phycisphaerae bacterium]|nr:sigma-70 family RNA polymerase sigma factor [Phycisphaerae bacterium]